MTAPAAREPPPDRLVNPTLVVGIGRFGSQVLRALEARVAEIGEVLGADTVRNLATLRVLTRDDLEVAKAAGLPGSSAGERRRGIWFDVSPAAAARGTELPDMGHAFDPGHQRGRMAFRGLDPLAPGRPVAAARLLREELVSLVRSLFSADRFVDYHPGDDRFPSRLDVYVAGDVGDLLDEAGHCAIQEALAELTAGPLSTLFPPKYANLSITHLVAWPVLDREDPFGAARRLVSRYRSQLTLISRDRRPVPARFLFVEDRSLRYVVTRDQLVSVVAEYLHLLTVRRVGNPHLLRDLVQPLPDIDRLRSAERPLNQICGTFSVATAEVPVHAIVRYCRNRQSIGLLNAYLDKPQDSRWGDEVGGPGAARSGETRETDYSQVVGDVEALLDTYASDGSLAATIDAWMGELEANLDRGFQTLLSKHGVGSWGLRRAEPWEHHDALVTPFHADLPSVTTTSVPTHLPIGRLVPGGGGGRRFDEGWLRAQCAKLKDAARDVERNHLAEAFTAVEHNAAQYTARWIDDEQRQVDELLRASPTGWKEALERLTRVVGEVEHRIEEWRERLRTARYRPLDTEYAERQGRTLLDQLQGVVDEKPHVARALRTGLTVGVAAGVAFGAALTLILPWAPGGVGALVLPAVAAGIWSAWRRLRQDEAQRTDTINALIDPEEGAFRRAFEEQQARIFDPASPTSYIGERVAWTCMLWRMRIWQGIQRALRQDIARLTDVGAAMDLQLHRVREDQEAIDVRFQEEDGTMLEDVERALESPDLFRRLLVGPGVLDAVYQTFSKPEARYADRHLHEEEPFELWRERTPFTDPDEMRRYCGVPFGEVLALDFFRFERTAPAVRAALADFLSDFTHKLALQSDQDALADPAGASQDQLVLTAPNNEALVRDLLPAGKWPVGWTLDTGLPDPHAVVMIRHVQDLAPWQLPALGSPADLVRSLLDTGGGETLPGVLASVPTLALRSVMAGVALDLLACGEADGPDSLCAELLKVALPRVSQGQAATDGHPWVPVERARAGWVERLQGQEGCLELAVVLYGSPPAPEHAGLELALARVELLLAAAEGQAEWAYDALGAVPRHWVAPLVLRLVEARLVGEYLTQRLYRDALAMLVRLEPQSLRASMIVRAAAQAVRQGAPEAAREIIALARAPRERKREPMPASFDLPHDEAHELVATLGQTDGLALALLGVYGAADHGPTASEPEWRVELLLKALDRGEAGAIELLGMAAEFPRGAVDPRLSRALRRVAAGAIDANRPIETTDAGEGA